MRATIVGRLAVAAAVVVSVGSARPAAAQPIIGKLNVSGDVNIFQLPSLTPFGQVIVDFLLPSAPPGFSFGLVETTSPGAQTGIFAGFGGNTVGTHVDLVLGPFPPPAQTTPGTSILLIGAFDFRLVSFAPGAFVPYPFSLYPNETAALTVRGFMYQAGLPKGTFVGTYTTQFPEYDPAAGGTGIAGLIYDIEHGQIVPSSVSASFVVRSIPEPATTGLVATGLVVLVGVGLRRRATVTTV